jgi:glycosyltransferase involved in cell wall biosynthesis
MKILFVLFLPAFSSGISSTRVEFLAKQMNADGHDVTVSCIFDPSQGEKPRATRWQGIRIISYLPFILRLKITSIIFNVISLIFTSWIPFAIARPDIVIISVPPGEGSFCTFLWSKMFRKKVVFDYRDEWEDYAINNLKPRAAQVVYKILKKTMEICYRKSFLVITVTEFVGRKLFARGVRNYEVITNGADLSVFRPQLDKKLALRRNCGLMGEHFVLIHSGLLGRYYKIDIVIQALKILKPRIPSLKLVLIGGGSEINEILSLAKSLGLSEDVIYMGNKHARAEVAEIISMADLGLIPFQSDHTLLNNTLPVKAFEYLASGVPVVATTYNDSMIGKMIKEFQIGLISEPENANSLAIAIEMIHKDHDFFARARENGLRLMTEHYDAKVLARKFSNLIMRT